MAPDAVIFALANPNPEVHPDVAHRHARVVATGRSDFPNQINNVLAFPGIFRGAFDVQRHRDHRGHEARRRRRARRRSSATTCAEDLIVPSPFDPRVGPAVRRRACAARGPACDGVARRDPDALLDLRRARRRVEACSPSTPSPSRPTTARRPGGGGASRARSPPTAGPRSRSRPPRSTTTTCGRCAGVGLQGGAAADDPRLRRRRHRRGRQRGRRARRHQPPGLDAATRPSTPAGRCCPSATRAPSPTGSPCRGRNVVPKPASLSFEEAACLPTAWLTAYRMLFVQGGCKPGDTVLVQGAGGGVATALIALARAGGLKVLATSRDEAKRDRALELGAHEVYETGAAAAEHGRRGDGDGRAGDLAHSVRSLRPGGTLVISGTTSGPEARRRRARPGSSSSSCGSSARPWAPAGAGVADDDARRDRRPAGDRPDAADGPRPRDGLRGDGRAATSSARSCSPADGPPPASPGPGPAWARRSRGASTTAATSLVLVARSEQRADELARRTPAATCWSPTWPTPPRSTALEAATCPTSSTRCCRSPASSSSARSATRRWSSGASSSTSTWSPPRVLTRRCLPALRATRGTVVFANSAAGLNASASWGAYAASKYGLRALADAVRAEEVETGVRVTSVFLSRTATPMQEKVHEQEGRTYDRPSGSRPRPWPTRCCRCSTCRATPRSPRSRCVPWCRERCDALAGSRGRQRQHSRATTTHTQGRQHAAGAVVPGLMTTESCGALGRVDPSRRGQGADGARRTHATASLRNEEADERGGARGVSARTPGSPRGRPRESWPALTSPDEAVAIAAARRRRRGRGSSGAPVRGSRARAVAQAERRERLLRASHPSGARPRQPRREHGRRRHRAVGTRLAGSTDRQRRAQPTPAVSAKWAPATAVAVALGPTDRTQAAQSTSSDPSRTG